jgi:hypothetical protein
MDYIAKFSRYLHSSISNLKNKKERGPQDFLLLKENIGIDLYNEVNNAFINCKQIYVLPLNKQIQLFMIFDMLSDFKDSKVSIDEIEINLLFEKYSIIINKFNRNIDNNELFTNVMIIYTIHKFMVNNNMYD